MGLFVTSLGCCARGKTPSDKTRRSCNERLLLPTGRTLTPLDIQAIWGGNILYGSANINLSDVLLEGWLAANGPHWTVLILETAIGQRFVAPNGRGLILRGKRKR